LAGLPRALAELTEGDQREVLKFAQYLHFRRAAQLEDTESESTE
jgi:hypothetical protein